MRLVELDKQTFDTYAAKHPLASFHQSSNWAEVKATNGWDSVFVGWQDDNGALQAAGLLLHKTMIRLFPIYYCPRGFLADYEDADTVRAFTAALADYVRKHGGIFFKIDPYLDTKLLDYDGNEIEGGYDHSAVIQTLKDAGYTYLLHKDGTKKTTMVTTIYAVEFEGRSSDELFKSFDQRAKRSIKAGMKYGVEIEDLTYDQLPRFKAMLQKTADRRGFIDRPLSYYQAMYRAFSEDGKLLFRMAKLNAEVYRKQMQERYDKACKTRERLLQRKQQDPQSTRFDGELKDTETNIEASKKRLDEVDALIQTYGPVIDLSCACYFLWGNEILNLYAGNEEDLLQYAGQYVLHWDIMQKALKEGYKRYNLYGIPDVLKKENNPTYGVYEVKRGFHGHVIRLLGEFDYVVHPLKYHLYQWALSCYNKFR